MTRYSKFIAAALAFLGVIVASGVLTGAAQAWANAIISGIGAAMVYLLPNADMPKRNQRGETTSTLLLVIVVAAATAVIVHVLL